MKKIYFWFTFLFLVNINAQEIDKTYYLLGAVDNYMGRIYEIKNPGYKGYILQVLKEDTFKIKRIEAVSGLKFSSVKSENFEDLLFLKSDYYEKEINKFYDFKKMKGSKGWLGMQNYTGKINIEKVLKGNEKQLISYVLGAFLMNGRIKTVDDGRDGYDTYEISVGNSKEQFEVLKAILKKHSYISKEEIWYKTPVTFHILFSPNKELKQLLDKEISSNKQKRILFKAL